jgi:hypothetical protein
VRQQAGQHGPPPDLDIDVAGMPVIIRNPAGRLCSFISSIGSRAGKNIAGNAGTTLTAINNKGDIAGSCDPAVRANDSETQTPLRG